MSPLTRTESRTRTRARARVIQALYAWESGAGDDLGRVAARVWDDLAVGREERVYAGRILRYLVSRLDAIDDALQSVLTNWRLERLGVIERSVLRAAAAELQMQREAVHGERDAPPRVVLQEAIRLAERFGTPDAAKFVNGVLDALARAEGWL